MAALSTTSLRSAEDLLAELARRDDVTDVVVGVAGVFCRVVVRDPVRLLWERCAEPDAKIRRSLGFGLASEVRADFTREKPRAEGAVRRGKVTIRFHAVRPPVGDVVALRRITPAVLRPLEDFGPGGAVAKQQLLGGSILVAGPTGSGKTTFLAALMAEILRQDARVVIIEDTSELMADECLNCTRLLSGAGITTEDLLRDALRLAPDVIVCGEVRTRAELEALRVIGMTHPTLGTLHARSLEEVGRRLDTTGFEGIVLMDRPDRGLGLRAIYANLAGENRKLLWQKSNENK